MWLPLGWIIRHWGRRVSRRGTVRGSCWRRVVPVSGAAVRGHSADYCWDVRRDNHYFGAPLAGHYGLINGHYLYLGSEFLAVLRGVDAGLRSALTSEHCATLRQPPATLREIHSAPAIAKNDASLLPPATGAPIGCCKSSAGSLYGLSGVLLFTAFARYVPGIVAVEVCVAVILLLTSHLLRFCIRRYGSAAAAAAGATGALGPHQRRAGRKRPNRYQSAAYLRRAAERPAGAAKPGADVPGLHSQHLLCALAVGGALRGPALPRAATARPKSTSGS